MRRPAAAVLTVAALAAAAAVPASGAGASAKATTPKVKVVDDFFSPDSLTIKKETKVKFKWDEGNTNSHNATIKKAPNGVKKKDFKSATGTYGIKFNPTFKKPGTYDFKCTIHPETMELTVKVKSH